MKKTAFRPIGLPKLPGVAGTAMGVGLKALDVMDVKSRAAQATGRMKRMQTPVISGAIPVQNVVPGAQKMAMIVVREGDFFVLRSSTNTTKIAASSKIGEMLSEFMGEHGVESAVFGDKGALVVKQATALDSVGKVAPTLLTGAAIVGLGNLLFQGAGQAISSAARGVGSIFERSRREKLFQEVIRLDPSLKSNTRSREYFDLIMTYAPSLGDHPTAIGDFLRRQMQYPVSGVEFLNQLATFEKTVGASRAFSAAGNLGHGFSQAGAGYLSSGVGDALRAPKAH